MNDIVFLPAHQLAKKIRDRTFSAVEVLEAHLVQLTKHNSKLNAVVTLNVERARPGSPVVVIPIGLTKDGLPVGIQIVGKRGRDMELLAVAKKLTEATEGFQKPPGY